MQQLYARVFLQILDSSIAEDFFLRHVFEDFIKLASKQGIVDMTREAMARRLNIPIDELSRAIITLESPDPKSRDPENQGRRIKRLDDHRDWGWEILNWAKYDALRTKADIALRVATHRSRKKEKSTLTPKEADRRLCDLGIDGSTVIPEGLAGRSDFVKVWTRWLDHLRLKKKPATIHAQDLQLNKLLKMGADEAILTLNHCIEHGWQGIYERNQNHAGNSAKPNPRNVGVAIGPTDYGEAAQRKLERQALEAGHQAAPKAQGT